MGTQDATVRVVVFVIGAVVGLVAFPFVYVLGVRAAMKYHPKER